MNRQIRSRVNYWDNWTNIRFTSKGQRPANYFFDSNDFEQMYVYSLFAQAHDCVDSSVQVLVFCNV